jgi:steroid 5-alpha reductase family enzyme
VGDWQLARFKAKPENQGKVMDQGLWRYTRHPNYFGDFCQRRPGYDEYAARTNAFFPGPQKG